LPLDVITTTFTGIPSPDAANPYDGTFLVVEIAAAAFVVICILILIAGKLFKNPKIQSKFSRKSSYDTLQTMQSKTK
jgi:hypothetical protein